VICQMFFYFIFLSHCFLIRILSVRKSYYELEKIINNNKSVLFIFENAHISDEVTSAFVKRADYFIKNYDNCYFLFVSRDFAIDEDIDPFRDWKKSKWLCFVKPDEILIETIINQFLKANNLKYDLSYIDREWIKFNLIYKSEVNQNVDGGDLRLLRLYLKSWDYKNINLYELSVLRKIISDYNI